ncbi:MAG: alanyl-tRNA editing protein [Eubacteriales bacterium]
MAVKKIFWEKPYLTETDAIITCVDNNVVTLDQTIIYAFSGGQQSDSGMIEGHQVIESKKDGKEIIYTIEQNHGLSVGQNVILSIDWPKRYKLMRLHFAAELILELVYQNYGHPEKIGANITEDKARVDFFWEGNISEIFPDLLRKIEKLISSNLEIHSCFEDADEETRYWVIDGFAKVPCGGTHLRSTGEIGGIYLKRNNVGYGKERIEIYLKPCNEKLRGE